MTDDGLVVYQLAITLAAAEPLVLEQHPGSALRGMIFHGLLARFCALPDSPACAPCPLVRTCPVASLVAPLRDEQPRGRDVPRPFVIRPPLIAAAQPEDVGLLLEAGQAVTFGVTLVGAVAPLFPYLVQAVLTMEGQGIGRPLAANRGRRGRFTVQEIATVHPWRPERGVLFARGTKTAHLPEIAVTPAEVAARAASYPADALTLRFLTPTRLIAESHLAHTPDAAVLFHRLAERLDALERAYATVPAGVAPDVGRWRAAAEAGATAQCQARDIAWIDAQSYSSRQQKRIPLGGFIGTATLTGDLPPATRALLAWGELLHVGKDTVKGNGWYQVFQYP